MMLTMKQYNYTSEAPNMTTPKQRDHTSKFQIHDTEAMRLHQKTPNTTDESTLMKNSKKYDTEATKLCSNDNAEAIYSLSWRS